MDESWTTPVNTRLHKLGAVVFRRLRSEVVEDQLNREAAAFQAELNTLDEELRQATRRRQGCHPGGHRCRQETAEGAPGPGPGAADEAKAETEAKLTALQAQAKDASDRTKGRIDKRMAEAKADLAARSKKLNQAWGLTKEALAA